MKAEDNVRAFERFQKEAVKVRRSTPLRADPALAAKNVERGVAAVLRHEIEIRRQLPEVDVQELRALPELARCVGYAAREVERAGEKKSDLRPLLKRSRALRGLLLSSAESLVAAGLLPAAPVAKVRSGLGVVDSATDCRRLAALFREHAVDVKGKTPVNRAVLDEAEQIGAEILERLALARAKSSGQTSATPTAASRDKLWTLLLDRHDTLWRVGAYFYGRDVDRHVPPLESARA